MKLSDAKHRTVQALRAAGLENPEREARLLICEACNIAPENFIAAPEQILVAETIVRLTEYTNRRVKHEPLSRISGYREFFGRRFTLSKETLDPRPDSETLIEEALAFANTEPVLGRPLSILDIGTGSGALLITLLAEMPSATGVGTDTSADALMTAKRNAKYHSVDERVEFHRTNASDGVIGEFDILISNPPYIPTRELAHLEAAVRLYDPVAALDGGPDGLAVYLSILKDLPRVVPRGRIVFEVGAGQADSVKKAMQDAGCDGKISDISCRKDLGGHIRCVSAATHYS